MDAAGHEDGTNTRKHVDQLYSPTTAAIFPFPATTTPGVSPIESSNLLLSSTARASRFPASRREEVVLTKASQYEYNANLSRELNKDTRYMRTQ